MFIALAAAAALQTTPPAPAKPAPSVHMYSGLSLSPDGRTMVTFEAAAPAAGGPPHGVITLRDGVSGAILRTLDPCATCRYSDAAWAPDSQTLAVVASDMKAGTATVLTLPLAGGDATTMTSFTGLAARLRWAPDGKTLAMLAVVNPHKQVGATQAGAAQVGEIGVASVVDEQRIATVSHAGDQPAFMSPDDTWVYEYDWKPTGDGFVATAAKGDGDNNWWVAKLESFGSDGKETVLAAPSVQMNYPRVAPDGQTVLFIGGLMSDFGPVGGDVYSVPIAGGEPTNLTPDAKVTFTSLTVTTGGVLAGMITGGDTGLARIDTVKGGYSEIGHSEVSANLSLSADGSKAAAVTESFTQAPAIATGTPGALKTVTHDNDAFTVPFTAKSVTWQDDGFAVQGWLMIPKSVAQGKTYPMVTVVHGGPSSAYTPRFSASGSSYELLKAGYYVFLPNPRGSYGQGEAFVQSNKRDFGGGDLKDIMSGIDAVEKVAPVDEQRLGVMGHSYGGLMTMWTVTHSTRFKAAIAGAGIANWSSYYGENGIDQWMIPFFGASFYDDPAIYDKLSPIRYIKNARTPTFIYVGERDVECPAAQSLEFWHGLKEMGVPTTLVIYEGEGHGIRAPEHTKDLSDREAAWFAKYLGQP